MLAREDLFIGGRWTEPASDGRLEVISPITETIFGTVPRAVPADVDASVAAARRAFDHGPWPRMGIEERATHVLAIAVALEGCLEDAVRLQVNEMGSPYTYQRASTLGILRRIPSDVELAKSIDCREVRNGWLGDVLVLREPVGVVGAIIPWNGPLGGAVAALVPALLTGCAIIIKPAEESPLSAYLLAEAAIEAGIPEGVLSIIPGGAGVGEHLVTHPGVDKISFTGGSLAGERVAMLCGKNLKRATLELGGKSAAIVLADADLDQHLPAMVESAFTNTGQICHATTRIFAPRNLVEELTERLAASVETMKVGDPHEGDTQFGPLVSQRQRDRVRGYIESGLAEGATAVTGGLDAPLSPGWYVQPTIFTHVTNSMRIAREEIFGPVVCVLGYSDEDEAVALANESDFGLGGAVFTSDVDHGVAVAARLRTGSCRINNAPPGGNGGPFGGVKRSGVGRVRGREGLEAFFELKSISVPPAAGP